MLHRHFFLARLFAFSRDRYACPVCPEALDVRVEQHADTPGGDGAVEGFAVVLEQTREFGAAVRQYDPVLLTQCQCRLDGAVNATDDEDILIPVLTGAVEAVVDVLLVFAFDVELARIAALAGRQNDPASPVGLFRGSRREQYVLFLNCRQRFLYPNIDVVVLDDLMSARGQVLFLGTVQPQLALGTVLSGSA